MRCIVLTFALLLGLPALASASQIAVGLDFRQNVFVQEFWQDGKARYAIYSSRPDAITLVAVYSLKNDLFPETGAAA